MGQMQWLVCCMFFVFVFYLFAIGCNQTDHTECTENTESSQITSNWSSLIRVRKGEKIITEQNTTIEKLW